MQIDIQGIQPEVFLFVNSCSGGGLGKRLLDTQIKKLTFELPRSQEPVDANHLVTININLFDMFDQSNKNEGFQMLAQFVLHDKPVIVVVCGGDGTFMWIVTEMSNFSIDHLKVPIAIIPSGTGNDLAQVFGWGKKASDLISHNYDKLKKFISYCLSAQLQHLDLWTVEAEVWQYGKFQKVQNLQKKILGSKTFTKHFCNYFSLGIDSKIGYSFDLHRTSSRMGNFGIYGMMGCIKSFTKTKNLGELISQFRYSLKQQHSQQKKISLIQQQQNKKQNKRIIFERAKQSIQIIKENLNLLALNINSFMGGVKNVWENAKLPNHLKDSIFTKSSHNDGKIEILSFPGAWSLGFENIIGGRATKLHQGGGPFEIIFNKYPQQSKHRTYFQVDGQYMRFTHPKSLVLKRSSLSKTGKIKVLRRIPLQTQNKCCLCSL